MNLEEKIRDEVVASRKARKTTIFLRRLILTVVDRVASAHYGEAYSMKCLQASAAICMLLQELGVKAEMFVGATCYAKISPDGRPLGWNGFWGDHHHVWATTEFYELVDLTVSQMHHHPASSIPQLEVPAVWWGDISRWPPVIRYLPDGKLNIELSEEDMLDLESFKAKVMAEFENVKSGGSAHEPLLWPVLLGIQGLQALYLAGNKWLKAAYVYQEQNVPFPDWVQRREAELMAKYPGK